MRLAWITAVPVGLVGLTLLQLLLYRLYWPPSPDKITLYRSPLDVHLVGRKTETVYIAWHHHPYFLPYD